MIRIGFYASCFKYYALIKLGFLVILVIVGRMIILSSGNISNNFFTVKYVNSISQTQVSCHAERYRNNDTAIVFSVPSININDRFKDICIQELD